MMGFYKKKNNKNKNQLKVKAINKPINKGDANPQKNNAQNTIQTIEQLRAKKALEEVEKILKENDKTKTEFQSYANELPAMIHMNGLGQAVAFYKSKGGTHNLLYIILSNWLGGGRPYVDGDLLDNITKNDMNYYHMAQSESQAFLVWLKSFAKAYL